MKVSPKKSLHYAYENNSCIVNLHASQIWDAVQLSSGRYSLTYQEAVRINISQKEFLQ